MKKRTLFFTLVFALALGIQGCGGGGGGADAGNNNVGEQGSEQTDTTVPKFSLNLQTNFTIKEDTPKLDVVTIEVEDNNSVSFALGGPDKDFFHLIDPVTRDIHRKVVAFKEKPDYEKQSHYEFSVTVTDDVSHLSATKNFTVDLKDKPFAFDMTTGSMGSVVENKTKNMVILTKEAKHTPIEYEIHPSNSPFTMLSGSNVLQFEAPDYNESNESANEYSIILTAKDGYSEINLTVTARVIEDTSAPVETRVFLLREKQEKSGGQTITTNYTYDDNNYLTDTIVHGGPDNGKVMHYVYEEDKKIMKGFDADGKLTTLRVFKSVPENPLADFIVENRLSLSDGLRYIYNIEDSAAYNKKRRMTKYIRNIQFGQAVTDRYYYDSRGAITKIESGFYYADVDHPFATADYNATLNRALVDDNMSVLPEYTALTAFEYIYDAGGNLVEYAYKDPADPSQNYTMPVKVKFNPRTKKLDYLVIGAASEFVIDYSGDGFLEEASQNDIKLDYQYSEDLRTVTVSRAGEVITTYIFEEAE